MRGVRYTPLPALAMLALISTSTAIAQQTYVSCVLPPEKKTPELHRDFTLDESAGTMSFYWDGQNVIIKEKAVFTADKVISIQPFYLGTSIRRTIDRVTLEYTEETVDGRKVFVSKGTCRVTTPPADRKF